MRWICRFVCSLVFGSALVSVAQEEGFNKIFAEMDYTGYKAFEQLLDRAPAEGFIHEEAEWFRLWRGWHTGPVPVIDFSKYVLIVATAKGKNKPRLRLVPEPEKRNLVYRITATKVPDTGFSYGLKLVDRTAFDTINGKPIPKHNFGGVRYLDMPEQDFSYRNLKPFVIRTKAERNAFLTTTKGSWGKTSEDIRTALRTRPIDWDTEMVVLLFHPVPERTSKPVKFGAPVFEKSRIVIPVDAPDDSKEENNAAGVGYILQQSDRRVFYRLNGVLRVVETLESDVGEKTFSNVRRYRLLLQSPKIDDRIFACKALQRLEQAGQEAVPELVACLRHEDLNVQTQAALAARQMGLFLQRSEGELRRIIADKSVSESGRGWAELLLDTLVALPNYKPIPPGALNKAGPAKTTSSNGSATAAATAAADATGPNKSAQHPLAHSHPMRPHQHADVPHLHADGTNPGKPHTHPVPPHYHPGGDRPVPGLRPPVAIPHTHDRSAAAQAVPHIHFFLPHSHDGALERHTHPELDARLVKPAAPKTTAASAAPRTPSLRTKAPPPPTRPKAPGRRVMAPVQVAPVPAIGTPTTPTRLTPSPPPTVQPVRPVLPYTTGIPAEVPRQKFNSGLRSTFRSR